MIRRAAEPGDSTSQHKTAGPTAQVARAGWQGGGAVAQGRGLRARPCTQPAPPTACSRPPHPQARNSPPPLSHPPTHPTHTHHYHHPSRGTCSAAMGGSARACSHSSSRWSSTPCPGHAGRRKGSGRGLLAGLGWAGLGGGAGGQAGGGRLQAAGASGLRPREPQALDGLHACCRPSHSARQGAPRAHRPLLHARALVHGAHRPSPSHM